MDTSHVDLNGRAENLSPAASIRKRREYVLRLDVCRDDPEIMLRLPDLVQWLGVSRATIYRWVAAGEFPAPVKLSARTSAWPRRAVAAWKAQRETQAA